MAPRLFPVLLACLLSSCSGGMPRPTPPIPRAEPAGAMGPHLELCRLPADLDQQPIEIQHARILACATINLQAAGACFRDKAALVEWIKARPVSGR